MTNLSDDFSNVQLAEYARDWIARQLGANKAQETDTQETDTQETDTQETDTQETDTQETVSASAPSDNDIPWVDVAIPHSDTPSERWANQLRHENEQADRDTRRKIRDLANSAPITTNDLIDLELTTADVYDDSAGIAELLDYAVLILKR